MSVIKWTEAEWTEQRNTLVGKYGEDIAQQAILQLWEQEMRGNVIERPVEFLSVVARNLQVDAWRKESCVQVVSLDLVLEATGGDVGLPTSLVNVSCPETLALRVETERQLVLLKGKSSALRSYHRKKDVNRLLEEIA